MITYPVKVHPKFLAKLETAHNDLLTQQRTLEAAQALANLAQKNFNEMLALVKEAQIELGQIEQAATIRNLHEGWIVPANSENTELVQSS